MVEDNQLPYPVTDFQKKVAQSSDRRGDKQGEWNAKRELPLSRSAKSFAPGLIKRNTNPFVVQNLFARFDMRTTTAYAQTDDKLLLGAVKRFVEIDDRDSRR
jgi:hypothetical protein